MKDLTTFTLSVIQELEDEGRFGTAHVYRSMLRAFQRYWESQHPKTEIRMRKVFDVATIQKFERHLLERMLKLNTMSTYLRMLRAVYNRALLAGLTGYVPGLFKHVYTGTRADVKRALLPAEMGQTLDTSASVRRELKEAQIWFALLFLLRGMPFADLARLRKCDFKDGVITYCRQKTGRQIRVHVTAEAAELIRQCADRRTGSPYLLNILGDENCRFPLGRR
ncbi:site-specific integrase, partial [Bacteroides stercoris]